MTKLTPIQLSLVEDLITCQRALEEANRPTDTLFVGTLGLDKLAEHRGFDSSTNMSDLMEYLLSMLAEEN